MTKHGQQKIGKHAYTYWKQLKISGSNGLSKNPESRKMDFGPFWGNYYSIIVATIFWTNIFRKNGSQVAPQAKVPS